MTIPKLISAFNRISRKNQIKTRLAPTVYLILSVTFSVAQEAILLPTDPFLKNIFILTPTSTKTLTITTAEIFGQQHTGIFSELRSGSAQVHLQKNRSRFTLNTASQQEGPVIKTNNLYAGYGVHLPIDTKKTIAAESNIGIINIKLGDAQAGDQSSDSNLDIHISGMIYTAKHLCQVSINHITEPQISPVSYTVKYPIGISALYKANYQLHKKLQANTILSIHNEFRSTVASIGQRFQFLGTAGMAIALQSTGDIIAASDITISRLTNRPLLFIIAYESQGLIKRESYPVPLLHIGIKLTNNNLNSK